eukprot:820697-Lingulodinium_polyedra.AAC.1
MKAAGVAADRTLVEERVACILGLELQELQPERLAALPQSMLQAAADAIQEGQEAGAERTGRVRQLERLLQPLLPLATAAAPAVTDAAADERVRQLEERTAALAGDTAGLTRQQTIQGEVGNVTDGVTVEQGNVHRGGAGLDLPHGLPRPHAHAGRTLLPDPQVADDDRGARGCEDHRRLRRAHVCDRARQAQAGPGRDELLRADGADPQDPQEDDRDHGERGRQGAVARAREEAHPRVDRQGDREADAGHLPAEGRARPEGEAHGEAKVRHHQAEGTHLGGGHTLGTQKQELTSTAEQATARQRYDISTPPGTPRALE